MCDRVVFVLAAWAMVALAGVRPASAQGGNPNVYRWINNTNANLIWNDPANWMRIAGPGHGDPNIPEFPNAPTDIASFSGTYTSDRGVALPNVTITVREIEFDTNRRVTIASTGAGIILSSADSSPATVTSKAKVSDYAILAPVELHNDLVVNVGAGDVVSLVAMSEAGGPRQFSKGGRGTVRFLAANTYSGPTIVEDGGLFLNNNTGAGQAVRGDLIVGDGNGDGASAIVSSQVPNQIADDKSVTIRADGGLGLPFAERLGDMIVEDGFVEVRGLSTLTTRRLTMTGGAISLDANCVLKVLEGDVVATSSATNPARLDGTLGRVDLGDALRTFRVADGPAPVDLQINAPLTGVNVAGVVKVGPGTLRFAGAAANTYPGRTQVHQGIVELARTGNANTIPGRLEIGAGLGPVVVRLLESQNISGVSQVLVAPGATVTTRDGITQEIGSLDLAPTASVQIGAAATLIVGGQLALAGQITQGAQSVLRVKTIAASSVAMSGSVLPAAIQGDGTLLFFGNVDHVIDVGNGPAGIDLAVTVAIAASDARSLFKQGGGVALFGGTSALANGTTVERGTLLVTGTHASNRLDVAGGTLGGTGIVGPVFTQSGGTIAPGLSPGRLRSGPLTLVAGSTYAVEINGPTPGSDFDQLEVTGAVNLGTPTLAVTTGFTTPVLAPLVIISNDGTDAINGTFKDLPEGASVRAGSQELAISYRGGDGNDVTLTSISPLTYFLAEGATGTFFDEDVMIANPHDVDAPVTLTFLQEGGATVVLQRTVPALSRLTIRVDEIAGLEATTASVQVVSDNRLPLAVERTMFWDPQRYGGHTANAVTQPEKTWMFGEGAQGFFDTFVLIANPNAIATTATLTFLREGESPVVKTIPIAPFARTTVFAGEFEELRDRTFGIVVETTEPVMAERAMYFGSVPGRNWSGGHVNIGAPRPSTSWFHAEGATGSFFETFILLSNPQDTPAEVDLQFLLEGGGVVLRHQTIGPRQRLTVNPAAEGDAQLAAGSVSTVVTSSVPIVSERSMYWPGEASPWGDGHSSTGVLATAKRWALAEGRVGRSVQYDTFILLTNPAARAADATITYLREGGGAPVVRTYTVAPASRHTIDVGSTIPELRDSLFGARIDVTNDVPIAVERSMYWSVLGVHWAVGSNALGTPIP